MNSGYTAKRMFCKFLVYYIGVMILSSLFVLLLYNQIIKVTEQNCIDTSFVTLNQVKNNIDDKVEEFDQIASNLVFDLSFRGMINAKRPKPAESSIYSYRKFAGKIAEKFYTFPYEYQIIFKKNEIIFVEDRIVYGLEFFFDNEIRYLAMDYEGWHETVFNAVDKFFLPMSKIKQGQRIEDAITYIFPINVNNKDTSEGVIQFLLYKEELAETLVSAKIEDRGAIYILDRQGTVIANIGNANSQIKFDMQNIIGEEGHYFVEGNREKELIIYTQSEESELIFLAVFPKSVVMNKTARVKYIAQFILVVYMLIGISLCMIFAYRNSIELASVLKKLGDILKDEIKISDQMTGEYKLIQKGVTQLVQSHQDMELEVKKKEISMQKYFFDKLLGGQFKAQKDIEKELEHLVIRWYGKAYCIAAIYELHGGIEIEQVIKDRIAKEWKGIVYTHVYEENYIILLFSIEDDNISLKQELRHLLLKLKKYVYEEQQVSIVIGVGKVYNSMLDIQFSFNQARDIVNRQDDSLFYEDMIEKQNMPYYPLELEQRLVNCTKSGDREQINIIFEELIDKNFKGKETNEIINNIIIYNIQLTLMKAYSEVVIDYSYDDLLYMFSRKLDILQKVDRLRAGFFQISDIVNERSKTHRSTLKNNIITYIEENYTDYRMCVALVADMFGFSDSYFSQFFKETVGDTFSSYLEKLRLMKACELIEQHPEMEFEEISEIVGYNNSNTFRRAFKRVLGITPSAYKHKA